MCRAKDIDKDQTYFLHEVKESEFKKCIFPLENLFKNQVREIASDINLSVSKKKDSVGICFVGERNMKDFLGRFISLKEGKILDDSGSMVGKHSGATLYTRGQRQGLKVGGIKGKDDLPWYVYDKDIIKNEIYVCQGIDNKLLFSKGLKCESISFVNDINIEYPLKCYVQVRHQHKPIACIINKENGIFNVIFDEEIRGVTPGQSAVFYNNNICLGGGIISDIT